MKNLTSQESQSMKIRFHRLFCAAAALFMGGMNSFGQEKTATNSVVPAMAISNPAQTNQSIQQPGEQNEDRAAALLRDYRGDLVFVKGRGGIGSGFIAQYKKHKYFITNAHVLAGNAGTSLELLDRTPLQLQTKVAIAAGGHDLICILVAAGGNGIPTVESVDTEVSVGDDIVAFGNALAGGVINPLLGKVVGLGPRT